MEKIRTILIVIVLIAIGFFGYLTYQTTFTQPVIKTTPTTAAPTQETVQQQPDLSLTPIISRPITPVNPTDTIQKSWKIYTSVPLGFSINHPNDMEPIKQGETIVFTKTGPAQKEGTEFFDGISLTFSTGGYNNDLYAAVNKELNKMKEWPTYESSTEIKSVSYAGKNGYSFSVKAMGSHTYIFLPRTNYEYLIITNTTADATGQGYEKIVSQMLSSLWIE